MVEQSYNATPSGRLKHILGIENSHADWPVDNTGISMDPPGSGLGGPWGGRGHLLGAREDSVAIVALRGEIAALKVNFAAMHGVVSSLNYTVYENDVDGGW